MWGEISELPGKEIMYPVSFLGCTRRVHILAKRVLLQISVKISRWSKEQKKKWKEHKQKHWKEDDKKKNLENHKQKLSRERYKERKGKGEVKLVAWSHRGAPSNLWLHGSAFVWVEVCLSVRTGQHQREQCLLWALCQAFANEKNIEPGCGTAADNKLDNVNNTNHPHNRGSNKAGVNRTTNLEWRHPRSLFLSSPS